MAKTLSKPSNLVNRECSLYEPKCGEPTCFHEWFRNHDRKCNPVKQHIEVDIVAFSFVEFPIITLKRRIQHQWVFATSSDIAYCYC
ncbi:hypothetical protein GCK32_017773 [Trichostrongylus colubriformis]|uniref:Uncharacterized protein n=1 Tax=Trichostrongylus colubriformis TaxID=6319 RepID=A0AAN8F1I8_TRICO